MKTTGLLTVGTLLSMVLSTFAQENTPLPAPPKTEGRSLAAGGTAYVRVKSYVVFTGEPALRDSSGGTAFVTKNLNPLGAQAIRQDIDTKAPNSVLGTQ